MENKTSHPIKPSRKWYLLALLLFCVGPLLGGYILYSTLSAKVYTTSFRIPGTWNFTIPRAGEYSLWTSTDNFKLFQQIPQDLMNFQLKFTDLKKGDTLVFPPKVGWKDHKGKFFIASLGTLSFQYSGPYQVTTLGRSTLFYKVDLRQPSLFQIVKALVLAMVLAVLGVLVGLLLAIIILVKRINARTMQDKAQKPEIAETTVSGPATTWAMFTHLSGFAGFLLPLANIIVPLIIWGIKRHEYSYVDEQGKEAINFQISITIYYLISALLIFLLIGLFLLPILLAFHIIAMIIASIESAYAKPFRYPLTIRFIQ